MAERHDQFTLLLDRRTVLVGAIGIGVFACRRKKKPSSDEPAGGDHVRSAAPPKWIEPPELYASPVGSLSTAQKEQLWSLMVDLSILFNMTGLVGKTELHTILDLMTRGEPSYLKEYENAIAVYASAKRDFGDKQAVQGLLRAFQDQREAPSYPNGELHHAEHYVFLEFCRLLLARGGFKQFGYMNYRGYLGTAQNNYRRSKLGR